jgi:molecular chaperone GrpE (heat shock protein)
MTESKSSLPWWPFLAADALFLALAALFLRQGHQPLLWWEAVLLLACVTAGAGCCVLPFLRRHQDEQALAQAGLMADALNRLQKIDEVAAQITGATQQWREFRIQTDEISASTKSLVGSIAAETKAFGELLQKANDSEKGHLRLEAEKLRRTETEWLQVVIHILDHVSLLYLAARHSAQPGLLDQIGQFQNGCRDIARRVGLAPITGREGDPFDPTLHQLKDKTASVENALVGETLAPGYTYQGKLVRRTLVALKASTPA